MAGHESQPQPQINSKVIVDFVAASKGLEILEQNEVKISIRQKTDGKVMSIESFNIERVLTRHDHDGEVFLQVNFNDGKKILLTSSLVGFRPSRSQGLDMSKVPNVVTTPDLISVVEALEDSLHTPNTDPSEVETLRRLFHCVLEGGEKAGFDLTPEKAWLKRLNRANNKASA